MCLELGGKVGARDKNLVLMRVQRALETLKLKRKKCGLGETKSFRSGGVSLVITRSCVR